MEIIFCIMDYLRELITRVSNWSETFFLFEILKRYETCYHVICFYSQISDALDTFAIIRVCEICDFKNQAIRPFHSLSIR